MVASLLAVYSSELSLPVPGQTSRKPSFREGALLEEIRSHRDHAYQLIEFAGSQLNGRNLTQR